VALTARAVVGRWAIVWIAAAGCELRPAPKPAPAPSAPPSDAALALPPDAPPAPTPPELDGGAAATPPLDGGQPPATADAATADAAAGEPTAACLEVGAKVAETAIATTTDPQQRAIYEQERAMIARRTAEVCTADRWTEAARRCFLAAATQEALQACGRELLAPR
jgi:hypothetical protein